MFLPDSSFMPSRLGQENLSTQNIFFSKNHAQTSGSSLFGGLLHKCKVQHFMEFQRLLSTKFYIYSSSDQQHYKHANETTISGISYLTNISNINVSDIGSQPVHLCFCKSDLPDCSYQPDTGLRKEKDFQYNWLH